MLEDTTLVLLTGKISGHASDVAYRCQIQNINAINCRVRGQYNVATIVGNCDNVGEITNCLAVRSNVAANHDAGAAASFQSSVECNVEASGTGTTGANIGTIAGTVTGALAISKCSSAVSVSGYSNVGGLVGNGNGSLTFTDCYYAGGLVKANSNVGGILGRAEAAVTITDSWSAAASVNNGSELALTYDNAAGTNDGHIVGNASGGAVSEYVVLYFGIHDLRNCRSISRKQYGYGFYDSCTIQWERQPGQETLPDIQYQELRLLLFPSWL